MVSVALDPRDSPVEFTMLHLIAPRFRLESSSFQSPVIVVSTHVDRLRVGGERSWIVSDGYVETRICDLIVDRTQSASILVAVAVNVTSSECCIPRQYH